MNITDEHITSSHDSASQATLREYYTGLCDEDVIVVKRTSLGVHAEIFYHHAAHGCAIPLKRVYRNHEFDFGYVGDCPENLSFSMLAAAVTERKAEQGRIAFLYEIVSEREEQCWRMSVGDIRFWLQCKRAEGVLP